MEVEEAELELSKGRPQPGDLLRPYERLFHDALVGEQTLFTRSDSVERIWEIAAPLLEHPPAPEPYPKGSWGPKAVERLPGSRGWELSTRLSEDG
jgi:glucose-6-phosphate 1-dehydrogenase